MKRLAGRQCPHCPVTGREMFLLGIVASLKCGQTQDTGLDVYGMVTECQTITADGTRNFAVALALSKDVP